MSSKVEVPYFKYQDVVVGHTPLLDEVLDDREKRVFFQTHLCNTFPNQTLIALKVNMPGPVKNNEFVESLLLIGKIHLDQKLYDLENIISLSKIISTPCGIYYFVIVNTEDALEIKKITIQLEDNHPVGRFLDFDVFINNIQISRSQMNIKARDCYLCSNPAKECGRNRTHTVEELLKYMIQLVNESR